MPKKLAQFYAAEIVLMLEHLQTQHVAHRDLKPQNLLITSENHLKLCDFGGAKRCDEKVQRSRRGSFVGTKNYVAPEVILMQMSGEAADLWSFGCIVYQMVSGKLPFNGEDEGKTFENILRGEYVFPLDFPEDAKDLCIRLLRLEKDKRIGQGFNGFEKLKAHEFFKGINFETILNEQVPMESIETSKNNIKTDLEDQIEYVRLEQNMKFEINLDYFNFSDENAEKLRARSNSTHKRSPNIIKDGIFININKFIRSN